MTLYLGSSEHSEWRKTLENQTEVKDGLTRSELMRARYSPLELVIWVFLSFLKQEKFNVSSMILFLCHSATNRDSTHRQSCLLFESGVFCPDAGPGSPHLLRTCSLLLWLISFWLFWLNLASLPCQSGTWEGRFTWLWIPTLLWDTSLEGGYLHAWPAVSGQVWLTGPARVSS